MEHVTLEIALLSIIGIVLISNVLNKLFKIPLPHSYLVLAFTIYYYFPEALNMHANENFDQILFFLIPIIIGLDVMKLKWFEVKRFLPSIIYLALFSVILSIAMGSSMFYFNLLGPTMTIGMYVALFSIVMATDAISVSNIFSQFKVPHNVQLLTEGDSLGNDATAMIAFYLVALPWIATGSFNFSTIPLISLKAFLIPGVLGLIVGYIGFILIKLFHSQREETFIIIAVAYGSFVAAEIFHTSGIFAIITGILLFKNLVDKELELLNEDSNSFSKVTNKERHLASISNIEDFASIAVVVLFVTLASMINIDQLIKYWKEILIVFGITTAIRAIIMAKFVLVGKSFKAIDYVGLNGWFVLTLAGMKGGLSIIMVHSLPKDFIMLEMFEAVTVGIILLSVFVYGFILVGYMLSTKNKVVLK